MIIILLFFVLVAHTNLILLFRRRRRRRRLLLNLRCLLYALAFCCTRQLDSMAQLAKTKCVLSKSKLEEKIRIFEICRNFFTSKFIHISFFAVVVLLLFVVVVVVVEAILLQIFRIELQLSRASSQPRLNAHTHQNCQQESAYIN